MIIKMLCIVVKKFNNSLIKNIDNLKLSEVV